MPVKIGSVVWPGLVGIGAGLIKSTAVFENYAKKADSLEVGSITQGLSEGNTGKTVWKYVKEGGLRHNAGLPNPGAEGLVTQLLPVQTKIQVPWGLNVAVTPGISDAQLAANDLAKTAEICLAGGLRPNWLTFNASSPDTKDKVSQLMQPSRVKQVLEKLRMVVEPYGIPIWLKIGVRKNFSEVEKLLGLWETKAFEAVVISNAMEDVHGLPGGWCGEPLRAEMLATVARSHQLKPELPIIGVGGINKGKDVMAAVKAGARAVQVVSALLFKGLDIIQQIKREYEYELGKGLIVK